MTTNIKYYTTKICFQEIPDEISFTYFITNCPNRCPDCHSPHLREDIGVPVQDTLEEDLVKQQGIWSCGLLMGGDDCKQIISLIDTLKICRQRGYKTALYSGFNLSDMSYELLSLLDYVKVGPYNPELGGLKSPSTNQRLYTLENGCIKDDITYRFWRSLDEH